MGTKAKESTKNAVPISSDSVRPMTQGLRIISEVTPSPFWRLQIKKPKVPPKPIINRIWPEARRVERSLINESSTAKAAMARVMKPIPKRFSRFMVSDIFAALNWHAV